jgi:fucose 4-O-acetylase-like acetyltransferase
MQKERNELIDILKGFSILLVVLGHSVQYNQPEEFDQNILFRFIYSFHMPLFMYLAGYVAKMSFDGATKQLVSRIRTLLLPFLSWFLVSYLFTWLINYGAQPHLPDLGKRFLLLIQNPGRGLWFLWTLFAIYIILFVSIKISKKHTAAILLLWYAVINILNTFINPRFGLMSISWYILFFTAGYAVRNYLIDQTKMFKYLCLPALIVFPLLTWHWSRQYTVYLNTLLVQHFSNPTNIYHHIYSVATAFSGIMASYAICGLIMKSKQNIRRLFIYPGKITLEIYATHYYFFNLLFILSAFTVNARIAVTFVSVLLFTIVAQWLIHKSRYAAFLLYGKQLTSSSTKKPE